MVLEKLGDSLKNTLAKIKSSIFVDEKLINELVKDIQRALLQSDVNVKLVFELTKNIKERALKENPPTGIPKKDYLITIVYEELSNFLGSDESILDVKKGTKLMLVGLFGNGKTTTAGKLAKYYQKRGFKIAMISLDVWRPAAVDQLMQIGKQLNIPVFGDKTEKDPAKIYKKFEKELSEFQLVIVDTAGRDSLNDELVDELNSINDIVEPTETLLVLSADIGQAAQAQAEMFHKTVNVTGVVITKLDGTAKGGGALSACSVTGAKVRFIGVGEKSDDLEKFDPKGFVGRLLGMGDIKALLEKAQEAISAEDAQDLGQKFLKGDFSLLDLYEQMQMMNKMGPMSKVMEMIPGMGGLKIPKEAMQVQQDKVKNWKFVMDSCTKKELEDPDVLSIDRIERISKGSGRSIGEIREMLKHYKQSKKMMKMFKGSGAMSGKQDEKSMQKMMSKMGKMKGMMKGFKF